MKLENFEIISFNKVVVKYDGIIWKIPSNKAYLFDKLNKYEDTELIKYKTFALNLN